MTTDRDQHDAHHPHDQHETRLEALYLIWQAAMAAPEPQRTQWLEAAGEMLAEIIRQTPDVTTARGRRHLWLVPPGITGLAAVMASASHKARAQPAATAGAMAVGAAAGAILYIGVPEDHAPAVPLPPVSIPHARPRPSASSAPAAPEPHRTAPAATSRTSATTTPTPEPAPTTLSLHAVLRLPTTTHPLVPVALPPVSPSPPDQHPTCLRLHLDALARVAVCAPTG